MSASKPADPLERLRTAPSEERVVWEALRHVEDPELPVSIVDLGLIYDVTVEHSHATIELTMTYSGCPARDLIVMDAETAVDERTDIDAVDVHVVHSPPWTFERVTDRGRKDLNEHGLSVPGTTDEPDPDCQE